MAQLFSFFFFADKNDWYDQMAKLANIGYSRVKDANVMNIYNIPDYIIR